jgi:hypothetical protein
MTGGSARAINSLFLKLLLVFTYVGITGGTPLNRTFGSLI